MAEQGWRDSADSTTRSAVWLAVLAAALLRFWALPQGLPFNPGVDEPEVMERAVRMMKTGDFNPHFFDYPSLYMYIQSAVAVLRFVFGAIQGRWSSLAGAPTEEFYLWGRAVTALLGTATVWILYRAALRWSERTALLSAVMLAVMPLHVRESHYTLTDVPVTFFVVLTLLLSLRAHERSTVWAFALAGAAAGLAGATKYNGLLAVVMPLVAGLMTAAARPSRTAAIFAVLAGTFAAFLIAAPYTVLDLPHFLNQFARLASEYRVPSIAGEPLWLVYLKHLRIALKLPGSLIVLAGIAVGLVRLVAGPNRLTWALAIVFPVLYFRFISTQNIVYGRYLLPLVPFLAILGAAAVVAAVTLLRAVPTALRHAAIVALTLITIVPPASTSISYDADAARTTTNQLAFEWIVRQLPPGTNIRFEGSVTRLKLPAGYTVSYVKQLRSDEFEFYAGTGIHYLVASSQVYGPYLEHPDQFPNEYADYQQVFDHTIEVARFSPSRDHPGPELRILKVKS